MDTTSSATSTSASASATATGHRICSTCKKRISDKRLDSHSICVGCRPVRCDLTNRCDECRSWTEAEMTDYLKHRKSLDSKRKVKPSTTVTSVVTRHEAGSVVASESSAIADMQRNMAAFMYEIRNHLASMTNPSIPAPSSVSLLGGFPGGSTAPPSSPMGPSLARPSSIPPISHTVMHAFF